MGAVVVFVVVVEFLRCQLNNCTKKVLERVCGGQGVEGQACGCHGRG